MSAINSTFGSGRYPRRDRKLSLKAHEIKEASMLKNILARPAGVTKAKTKGKTKSAPKVPTPVAQNGTGPSRSKKGQVEVSTPEKRPGRPRNTQAAGLSTLTRPAGVKKAVPKGKATVASTAEATNKGPGRSKKAQAKMPAAKKGRPKKTTTVAKKATTAPITSLGKRKNDNVVAPPASKKARVTKQAVVKPKIIINKAPTQRLDVFVMGEGSSGELGLGTAKNAIDVKRPRLNQLLSAKDVGLIQIACGGMHVAALTCDNKILTWGVNDDGALGRDTQWEGRLKDMDDNNSDDSDKSDNGLNPFESTPTAIPGSSFAEGTVFVKVSAGDSHTLALTDEGNVYGWGQFRKADGFLGFLFGSEGKQEDRPVLLSQLKNIVDISSGANHCMALDNKGAIFVWGCGEQNQLGWLTVARHSSEGKKSTLKPQPLRTGKRRYKMICTGMDHSLAIDVKDELWAWGANNGGACGIVEGAGEDGATVVKPTLVENLDTQGSLITQMTAGQHHSVVVTQDGKALGWGKMDIGQLGMDPATIPHTSALWDDRGTVRVVIVPTVIPNLGTVLYAATGTGHTITINDEGKAFAFGLSATYQTGLGTDDDVLTPTQIDNTAVRDKRLNWAGCGGQYSVLTAPVHVDAVDELADHAGEGSSGS